MGLNDLELTEEVQKRIHERQNQKAALEAKRAAKYFSLFPEKKLTEEEKKHLFEKIKDGFASEQNRNFKYGIKQYETKVYSPKVIEQTNLCIANFKQALEEDEYLKERYGKFLDGKGQVKDGHKLWLLERMEGYLSSDMYKRPTYSKDAVDMIFFLGTSGKIAPRQMAEAEEEQNHHRPGMRAAL